VQLFAFQSISKFITYSLICSLVMAAPAFLKAQDGGIAEEHQKLNEELLLRYETTKIPKFLEEKKGQIDEVLETGLKYPIETLRALLESDAQSPNVKLSSLVDFSVYSSFQHQTKMENFLEILKVGQIKPRKNNEAYSYFGVYLELHLLSDPKPFSWGDVELHFSPALIDRNDYHINSAWNYGQFGPDSASPAVNMGRAAYHVSTLLKIPGSQNEFVFHEPVPMSALVKIVIPTGKKAGLIRELKKNGVTSPVKKLSWDQLIFEQNLPAPKADLN